MIASEDFKTKETQDKVSDGIMQLMKDLGIPALNLSEGQNPIKDLIAIDLSSPQNTNGYQCADLLKNISYITRTLLNNQKRANYNPMLIGEKESTYSNYKNILQIIGPYIEDSVEASVYENGKMYYSFTTPSFLQKEINKVIDELLGGYEKIYGEKISGSQHEKEAYDKVMSSIAISASNYEELSLVLRNNA